MNSLKPAPAKLADFKAPHTDPTASDRHFVDDLRAMVLAAPSSYHASELAALRLVDAGFTRLEETADWPTSAGSYVVVREGSVIAWVQPENADKTTPFHIFGAHTDSPGLKLKPKSTIGREGFVQVGVEIYGGALLNSWLDRDLRLGGRLVTKDGKTHLVHTPAVVRVPQLAVHLDRSVNQDGLKLHPQQHMQPIFSLGDPNEADVLAYLCQYAEDEVSPADVTGYDIITSDAQTPEYLGTNEEFFASGRMDNLACTHAGLHAILQTHRDQQPHGPIGVYIANDHEEIGSASRSGAAGTFLEDVLLRIHYGLGGNAVTQRQVFAASTLFSADVGHSVHPNYAERHDPTNHPLIGSGPILKVNANHRYSTDAVGASRWAAACAKAGVEYQEFVSANNMPCGSTIGPITETRLGITTVDVGLPILSMHSVRELLGVADSLPLQKAAAALLTYRLEELQN